MPDRSDREALLLANLAIIERIFAAISRRHALSRDAAEEFAAWAKLRLIENDYAILAKFRGESTLATYLAVVLAMLFREYRVHEWGRWRPSAAAKSHGALAIKLEILVMRDGVSIAEAGERLRTAGETTFTDRELAAIVAAFPRRTPARPVQNIDTTPDVPSADRADDTVLEQESDARANVIRGTLEKLLNALPREDALIVRLRFMKSMSVADVARALAIPQKPLYRRLERLLAILRAGLERAGISRDDIRELGMDPP